MVGRIYSGLSPDCVVSGTIGALDSELPLHTLCMEVLTTGSAIHRVRCLPVLHVDHMFTEKLYAAHLEAVLEVVQAEAEDVFVR